MWEDVKMRRWGEDGRMRRCEDEKMWRWEDVKMRRCEDERMWRWEDVKMRGCEDERMWRWEDVKMRGCEDEKMWRWEDVKMRRCFTDPHYWKNPALRRSREKDSMMATVLMDLWCVLLRFERYPHDNNLHFQAMQILEIPWGYASREGIRNFLRALPVRITRKLATKRGTSTLTGLPCSFYWFCPSPKMASQPGPLNKTCLINI